MRKYRAVYQTEGDILYAVCSRGLLFFFCKNENKKLGGRADDLARHEEKLGLFGRSLQAAYSE